MGTAASQTFPTLGTWTSPPGYAGPVLFTGFVPNFGSGGDGNASGLFLVGQNTSYTVYPGHGSFAGQSISNFQPITGSTITWWPGIAAHQVFTASGEFVSPPGNLGPVLWYNNSFSTDNEFAGLGDVSIDGLGITGCVNVAGVTPNSTYAVTVVTGSTIVAYFP